MFGDVWNWVETSGFLRVCGFVVKFRTKFESRESEDLHPSFRFLKADMLNHVACHENMIAPLPYVQFLI